jgi:hypothetical protein
MRIRRATAYALTLALVGCGTPSPARYTPNSQVVDTGGRFEMPAEPQPALCGQITASGQIVSSPISGEALMSVLRPLGKVQKDQFESSSEYQTRMIPAAEAAAAKLPTADGVLAISADVRFVNPKDYDADTEVLTLRADERGAHFYWPLHSVELHRGSYDAVNRFGAPVEVTSVKSRAIGLNLVEPDGKTVLGIPLTLLKIRLPRDEARRDLNHLAVVFYGTLTSPYYKKGTWRGRPTYDQPWEFQDAWEETTLATQCAFVYNKRTGVILARIPTKDVLAGLLKNPNWRSGFKAGTDRLLNGTNCEYPPAVVGGKSDWIEGCKAGDHVTALGREMAR